MAIVEAPIGVATTGILGGVAAAHLAPNFGLAGFSVKWLLLHI